ncbi:uncharacterized protein EI90DRAFT_3013887 [Cantharellus anzutake]|uniref:uncharacterized protein n=1 Tax=Cantharellus anzutake TaxID=1750568 RepID=UPI0019077FAA|nr:uncharacterized protein EI90DRAFT_3013887 [Cantharellus anzutake]KAF8336900.1 hypothetical protein EI90DRAFT_3013887 [Cantharellus anzutake]
MDQEVEDDMVHCVRAREAHERLMTSRGGNRGNFWILRGIVYLSSLSRGMIVMKGEGINGLLNMVPKKAKLPQSVSITKYPCCWKALWAPIVQMSQMWSRTPPPITPFQLVFQPGGDLLVQLEQQALWFRSMLHHKLSLGCRDDSMSGSMTWKK